MYRALDAVIGLKQKGIDAGLINKSTLNVVDESMMRTLAKAPWVLVVDGWNVRTGLGSRFGDYLLRAGFKEVPRPPAFSRVTPWASSSSSEFPSSPRLSCAEISRWVDAVRAIVRAM